jgi:50S ribosomal subunit-associated GTPase HflX
MRDWRSKMAWTHVTIKGYTNARGDEIFDVVTRDGGYTCRSEIYGYKSASLEATKIDEKMKYEAEHSAGSLDTY